LAPGGIIAVHISNTYLRLGPVVLGLADHLRLKTVEICGKANEQRLVYGNTWMLVTGNSGFLKAHPPEPPASTEAALVVPLWTDQYSNLFQILRGGP
jgi:hypothetical protein